MSEGVKPELLWESACKLYPYLEEEDLPEALAYAAWRAEEIELPLVEA